MTELSPYFPLILTLYVLEILCVVYVLLSYRTAQGAIAWIIALLTLPVISLLLFALFGRNKLTGYVRARRTGDRELTQLQHQLHTVADDWRSDPPANCPELATLSQLVQAPLLGGNQCTLLVNGEATFRALFAAIDAAQHYIALQFYIVRNDRIGQSIKDALIAKVQQGVRVYFIIDEVGSAGLANSYMKELQAAGVDAVTFGSFGGLRNRTQINFRNHRKSLICDGTVAFVGGINLGDEYLGEAGRPGSWRDTQCQIVGPAALAVQLAFLEDWYWATNQVPALNWVPQRDAGAQHVLILPTGPADELESCTLMFLQCINSARERLWITSPYFVPDLQIMSALQLACLRGVDVRILIPKKPDHLLVHLAAHSYLADAELAGIRIYQYQAGFMHQKVMLVDHRYALVGTANLDNRSMQLNFEMMVLVADADFVGTVETMLNTDLAQCEPLAKKDFEKRSLAFRLACRGARLLAPLL